MMSPDDFISQINGWKHHIKELKMQTTKEDRENFVKNGGVIRNLDEENIDYSESDRAFCELTSRHNIYKKKGKPEKILLGKQNIRSIRKKRTEFRVKKYFSENKNATVKEASKYLRCSVTTIYKNR